MLILLKKRILCFYLPKRPRLKNNFYETDFHPPAQRKVFISFEILIKKRRLSNASATSRAGAVITVT